MATLMEQTADMFRSTNSLPQHSHSTLTCPRQFLLLAQGWLFVPECIVKHASSPVIKSPECHLRQGVVPFSHNNSACPQCLRQQSALTLKALKSDLVDHFIARSMCDVDKAPSKREAHSSYCYSHIDSCLLMKLIIRIIRVWLYVQRSILARPHASGPPMYDKL